MKRVLEVEPGNVDAAALLCNCYLISGQTSHGRMLVERCMSLDPLSPLANGLPGWADFLEGKFAAALPSYERLFEMDPGNPMACLFYVYVLAVNERTERVREVVQGFPLDARDGIPARLSFFLAHAHGGEVEAATVELSPQVEAAARTTDMFSRLLAHGYSWLGQIDKALSWLRVAIDCGFINYPFLVEHHPLCRQYRSDSEFSRLMDDVRVRWQSFEP